MNLAMSAVPVFGTEIYEGMQPNADGSRKIQHPHRTILVNLGSILAFEEVFTKKRDGHDKTEIVLVGNIRVATPWSLQGVLNWLQHATQQINEQATPHIQVVPAGAAHILEQPPLTRDRLGRRR